MINSIQNLINRYTLSQYISRLLTAWVITLFVTYLRSGTPFTEHSFYDAVNFPVFIGLTALMFALACLVEKDEYITVALISVAMAYSLCIAAYSQDYMFSFGLCAVVCILVVFSDFSGLKPQIEHRTLWIISAVLVVGCTAFVGTICCLYYLNYWTPCFDFGLFAQMFHYMRETGECLITCERDGLLSHFAVHFSPIYYLILPVYALLPSPCTLLVVQAFIVASGVFPLILLCKHYKLSNAASLAFGVCYLLYPAFLGGCFWYLHENCFLAPLILWFIYFTEKDRKLSAVALAFLTMTVKEDAPVYIAVVALYFIFIHKNYKCNLCVLVLAVVYFLIVTELMSLYGEGIMSDSRYGDYIYDEGGLFTVIKSVLQNPAFAIKQIFRQDKTLFILQMSVPLCFVHFVIKSPAKLILLIPLVLVNLMTNYSYQYDIGFQYTFGSGVILFYLAVTNYSTLGRNRGKTLLCALLCSLVIFFGGYGTKAFYINNFITDTTQREIINEALSLIPDDASVASSTFILTNLSRREVLYELETTKNKAEYYVLDLRFETEDYDIGDYRNVNYTEVFYEENVIAVFKSAE